MPTEQVEEEALSRATLYQTRQARLATTLNTLPGLFALSIRHFLLEPQKILLLHLWL